MYMRICMKRSLSGINLESEIYIYGLCTPLPIRNYEHINAKYKMMENIFMCAMRDAMNNASQQTIINRINSIIERMHFRRSGFRLFEGSP